MDAYVSGLDSGKFQTSNQPRPGIGTLVVERKEKVEINQRLFAPVAGQPGNLGLLAGLVLAGHIRFCRE